MAVQAASTEREPDDPRRAIAEWLDAHGDDVPEFIRVALTMHVALLEALASSRSKLANALNRLRQAMGILPKSERRPKSGTDADATNASASLPTDPIERLKARLERVRLRGRKYRRLLRGAYREMKRVEQKLERAESDLPVAEDEPTAEQLQREAEEDEREVEKFVENLQVGDGPDSAFEAPEESLMRATAARPVERDEVVPVPLARLENTEVIDTRTELRVRHDLSLTLERVAVHVEKKIVIDSDGERRVISASTTSIGPPRFSVTWRFLVTLTMLVTVYAMPMNRVARMISCGGREFSASALGKMLHYVARRFSPVYLQLFDQLADADIMMGDDTSARIVEVQRFMTSGAPDAEAPWNAWPKRGNEQTDMPGKRRSLSHMLARELGFCFDRRRGEGKKRTPHVTVLAGRAYAKDPTSHIVFYRSHLGGFGNLLEVALERRSPKKRKLELVTDLSTVNLVRDEALLERFEIGQAGCSAHARRPFERYEHEDPAMCGMMLDQFGGLQMVEEGLDTVGRNAENVALVRKTQGREVWQAIHDIADLMARQWSAKSKLGEAARYIQRNKAALERYLDDPRLPWTNNGSERALRHEKQIEASSMFRMTLEGRFALDILRTIGQTATAAGAPLPEYFESVLRTPPSEVATSPDRFTPHAWMQRHRSKSTAKVGSDSS